MKTEVFYCKNDMHVRPMRFSILCTPTDSSDKTQLKYSFILLCLFVSIYDVGSRLNYGTAPCPAINWSILIRKSFARTKQSVISVALKTPLEIRLGICIYKTSLLHRPDDYIGFPRSCPSTFCNKIASMRYWETNDTRKMIKLALTIYRDFMQKIFIRFWEGQYKPKTTGA